MEGEMEGRKKGRKKGWKEGRKEEWKSGGKEGRNLKGISWGCPFVEKVGVLVKGMLVTHKWQ